jgi:hypothetical protein
MKRLAVILLLVVGSPAAHADTVGARWLRERINAEWMAAAGAWRTSLGAPDLRDPGMEALGGGTELLLGLDIYGPLGIVLDGRFLGGLEHGEKYLEGLGGLGFQVHLSETVRLRAGATAGQLFIGDQTGFLVGGWLGPSIDLFPLGGHVSIAFSARLDVDAVLDAPQSLPSSSLALTIGLGIRY